MVNAMANVLQQFTFLSEEVQFTYFLIEDIHKNYNAFQNRSIFYRTQKLMNEKGCTCYMMSTIILYIVNCIFVYVFGLLHLMSHLGDLS